MKRLDASAALDPTAIQQLVEDIKAELGELGLLEFPIGIVAECFLGPPYRVHILDLNGMILEHFEAGRLMPAPFEAARSLALHRDYEAVEVYPSQLIPFGPDGSASPVPI